MILERDFAGVVRKFRLGFGEIMDIETACGEVPIGSIYKRLASFDWRIAEVFHVIKRALVGGGVTAMEAERLVKARIDTGELGTLVSLALDILLETIEGAPKGKGGTDSEPVPLDRGLIYKHFAEVGIAPQDVDAMDFAKVLMLFEAMSRDGKVAPPSAEEFREMRARVESGALDWSLQPTTKTPPEGKDA